MNRQPNILLIITDQQRGDCLGIEDHPVLMTPNMDFIAKEGVRFTKAYSSCPTCIAARRSLLSGQFPTTHGMVGYQDFVEWDAPLTLPQVLKENGYQTYMVGRSMHQHPERKRYGYDHMVSNSDYLEFLGQIHPNIRAGTRDDPHYSSIYYSTGVMHNDWTARPWPFDEWLHQTNWTVNEGIRFLQNRDPSCPYFLTLSFLAPHPPLLPPPFYMERYLRMKMPKPIIGDWSVPPENDGKGYEVSANCIALSGEALQSCKAAYFGLINHIDDQIRRILNPIDGIDHSNTIIIFTSDHGEMLGDHYLWRKTFPYEGSARIPFVFKFPEDYGFKKGSEVNEAVCLEDIMPTILDVLDLEIPESVEGKSIMPLIREESTGWREYIHIEHAPLYHCLTDGKEKYIWFTEDGREQMFDLEQDQNECCELSKTPKYKERLELWKSRMVKELVGRHEGFCDGEKLVTGCNYPSVRQDTVGKINFPLRD